MTEAATPETAAERITREIVEALDRFVDETASEAEAAARLASDTSAIIARIRASESPTSERSA